MTDIKKWPEKCTSQCLILVEFLLMLHNTKTKNLMERFDCYTKCLGLALFMSSFTGLTRLSSKSLINSENNNGEKFSPCVTPLRLVKYSDWLLPYNTQDFIPSYIFLITSNILPVTLYFINLLHRASLHTRSNAFL